MSSNPSPAGSESGRSVLHGWALLVAGLLYIFGEKSLTLAQLGLYAWNTFVLEKPFSPDDPATFEIALVGLGVGSSLVVAIALLLPRTARQDTLAILTGLFTASLAAAFNIAEATLLEPQVNYGQVPKQATFFFSLWWVVVIGPCVATALKSDSTDNTAMRTLGSSALAIVLGLIAGTLLRQVAGRVLRPLAEHPNAPCTETVQICRELAFDSVQFESDTLVVLGAVWIVAITAPRLGWIWGGLLVAFAGLAGYAFPVLLDGADTLRGLGYGALCIAIATPALIWRQGVVEGGRSSIVLCAAVTAAACALAMYFGLGAQLDPTIRIATSAIQAIAGALAVFAASLAMVVVRGRV